MEKNYPSQNGQQKEHNHHQEGQKPHQKERVGCGHGIGAKNLNQMNDIQIKDDDYEMVEDDDNVVSLGDESTCESI